jgi:hypothetical protein
MHGNVEDRFGKELLDQALSHWGNLLEQEGQPRQRFVACGGCSSLALDLVTRTATRDVDSGAIREPAFAAAIW